MIRRLLLVLLTVLLATGAARADAQVVSETAPIEAAAGTPPTAVAPACTPQLTLQRSLSALRTTLRRRIPNEAGRTMRTRLTPCGAGKLTLVVRHGARGPVLARASRTLRSTQTATFRLRTTKAIERLEGKRLRLRLQVTLDLTP